MGYRRTLNDVKKSNFTYYMKLLPQNEHETDEFWKQYVELSIRDGMYKRGMLNLKESVPFLPLSMLQLLSFLGTNFGQVLWFMLWNSKDIFERRCILLFYDNLLRNFTMFIMF